MIKNLRILFAVFAMLYAFISSAQTLHFDRNLLEANGITAGQLNDALNRNTAPPGFSVVDIYVNNKYVSTGSIFSENNIIYFSEDIKNNAGISSESWTSTKVVNNAKFHRLNHSIRTEYDRSDATLRLVVSTKLLINPDGMNRVTGGTGAFVNYNAYGYRFNGGESQLSSLNADYEAGINTHNMIIRAHGTYSAFRSHETHARYNHIRDGYAERDIGQIRIRAGRSMVSDGGFGTGFIDGAMVSSSTGNNQAFVDFDYDASEILTIEFLQNNLLLWKQTVQKGHAELKNIPVSGFADDVIVLIKRNDQVIDSRLIVRGQINAAQDGSAGYYAFSGRTTSGSRSPVTGAGFSHRFSDKLRPAAAMVSTSRYHGIALSNYSDIGRLRSNLWLTTVRNENREMGSSLNLTVSFMNSSLSYMQNSRHFSYLDQALLGGVNSQRSSIGIAQSLRLNDRITGNFSFTHYNFYDAPGFNSVSTGLNLALPRASVGVNLSYMSPIQRRKEADKVSMNLFLSVPLNFGEHQATWRSQYYNYAGTSRLMNSLGAHVSDNYTLTASQMRTTGAQRSDAFSLDNSVTTPYTTADISLSQNKRSGLSSQTTAVYASGAIAASRKGIIFSPSRVSDTWAVVDTGVRQYLKVSSLQGGAVTNHDGKAIISPITDSGNDFIRVSPEGLPQGVVIANNIREFSAKRGSVGHFNFNAYRNRLLLLKWRNKPAKISQSDVFYDSNGKMLARFIDKDILIIDEGDLKKLEKEGMSSPSNINVKYRLLPSSVQKKEKIKNVIFNSVNA
ncbi:fimbria/pilus outer membrane usher protein [Lonsdalea quercina]|uniref:fimbria/pilus outer membrane usher protein n=1 Tax=Lonsdalea quercina TaxID=71657 RepID=UPI003975AB14